MAQLGRAFQNQMSAHHADFYFDGANYSTIWCEIKGPVGRELRRKGQGPRFILLDMWLNDEDAAPIDSTPSVLVGQEPWIAALESGEFDALFGETIRIGELGPFQFEEDYRPDEPEYHTEQSLLFALQMVTFDSEFDSPDDVPYLARPKVHANLVKHLKAYEWYREKRLRESIFFYHWSRDCDLCESEGAEVFRDWFEAAEWIQGFGESAEGPQHLSQMTYEQWRVFDPAPVRDRGLEQFEEYGYGH